jgi:transcriptional regulator with XRE-family HTH domain
MRKSIHTIQYRTLLKLLIQAREGRHITQVTLAKRLQTTQSAVSKVERGERRLDVVELHTWCKALGIPFPKFASDLDAELRKL